jgi:NAD+ kinase
MKFGIFVHPKRPKACIVDILKVIRSAGVSYSKSDPDIAIIVGGDGTFGYYGRTLTIPMLFVGVKDPGVLGSKSRLAEIFVDHLAKALTDIEAGRYCVDKEKMLSVRCNGYKSDVLTDVYLERGIFAGSLRYAISVESKTRLKNSKPKVRFTDYAIANGVIVSTSFGSAGYYSYPDRIKANDWSSRKISRFSDDKIGICHILPSFLVRKRNGRKKLTSINYTVPAQSIIKITLMRDVNARLYGITKHSRGIAVGTADKVTISQSNRTVKIIRLKSNYQ